MGTAQPAAPRIQEWGDISPKVPESQVLSTEVPRSPQKVPSGGVRHPVVTPSCGRLSPVFSFLPLGLLLNSFDNFTLSSMCVLALGCLSSVDSFWRVPGREPDPADLNLTPT